MSADFKALTEPQQIAMQVAAWAEEKTLAQLRRNALAAYADRLLRDEQTSSFVRRILKYRREHGVGRAETRLRVVK